MTRISRFVHRGLQLLAAFLLLQHCHSLLVAVSGANLKITGTVLVPREHGGNSANYAKMAPSLYAELFEKWPDFFDGKSVDDFMIRKSVRVTLEEDAEAKSSRVPRDRDRPSERR